MTVKQVSSSEVEMAAEVLSRLEPGYLPFPLFEQITRICVTPIVELVPFRNEGDEIEVLLIERPADDPNWAGELHTPGTVLRSTDTKATYESALNRLLREEIGLSSIRVEPQYVKTAFREVKRGSELSSIFWIDLTGVEVPNGQFFNVNSLPENIVSTQHELISLCLDSFKTSLEGDRL